MKITVNKDNVKIEEFDIVHEGEHRVNKCSFSFSEEYTEELVKKAIFTSQNSSVEVAIINNECNIPTEILKARNIVLLGVYAYKVVDDKLDLRYSPSPDAFKVNSGSYIEGTSESEEITPSQFEQYMQALNDGLNKVEESIKKMDSTTSAANDLVEDISQKLENGYFIGPEGPQGVQGVPGKDGVGITTITSGQSSVEADKTITPVTVQKTDGSSQIFKVEAKNGLDGQNGINGQDGKDGKDGVNGQDGLTPTIGENGNWFIGDTDTGKPSRGEVGPTPNLSDYVKNTDYASYSKGGVIKTDAYSVETDSNGFLRGKILTKEQFVATGNSDIISKGTMENIKDDYVESSNPVITLNNTLDNLVRKNRVSDYIVSLKDALKYKVFEFLVHGKTQQKTTTGKNKFDISSLINRTQTIGASTGNIYTLKPNTQYTVSTNMVTSSSNDSIAIIGTPQSANAFIFVSSDTTIEIISSNTHGVGTINNISRTLMTDDTGNIFVGIRESASSSLSDLISKGGYIQIEEGDVATSCEPYTGGQPSPSPDYPQPITTLTFDKITRCGKNLFDVNDTSSISDSVSIDDDGWINVNIDNSSGTNTKFANVWTYPKYNIKVNTSYKLVLEIKSHSGNNGYLSPVSNDNSSNSQFNNQYQYFFYNIVDNSISVYDILSQKSFDKAKTMIRTFVACSAGEKLQITFRISVIENTSVTPQNFVYEPYQATEYTIDLQGNEMVELPNGVKDELVIDKYGNVNLIKNVGKVVLDGSESWFIDNLQSGLQLYSFYTNVISQLVKNGSVCISNYFKENTRVYNNDYIGIYINFASIIRIKPGQGISSIKEFKSWLSTHNTTVYYELVNPQTISLGKLTNLITTEEGINNFFINGNLETTLEVLYARDSEKYLQQYIDDKLATLSQAIIEEG